MNAPFRLFTRLLSNASVTDALRSESEQIRVQMCGSLWDRTRAPVAFGRRAVPRLFEDLQDPDPEQRIRALNSLCDLIHDPERLYQTVTGGFMDQIKALFKDENPTVRTKTCQLLHLLMAHSIGRQCFLSLSLVSPLSELLDDPSDSCRISVHRVLNRLALLPAGAHALLPLVPRLMQKLKEDDVDNGEELVLLLSTLSSCCRSDAIPALSLDGVALLRQKLNHQRTDVRRNAAGTMKELSVPLVGKHEICEGAVLPVLADLLLDTDLEVQSNAAGTIMNTVIITEGKRQCLDLNVVPVLLDLISKQDHDQDQDQEVYSRRKFLVLFCLRTLSSVAEAPDGRSLLLEQLPLLVRRTQEDQDKEVRRAAQTAVRVVTWTP